MKSQLLKAVKQFSGLSGPRPANQPRHALQQCAFRHRSQPEGLMPRYSAGPTVPPHPRCPLAAALPREQPWQVGDSEPEPQGTDLSLSKFTQQGRDKRGASKRRQRSGRGKRQYDKERGEMQGPDPATAPATLPQYTVAPAPWEWQPPPDAEVRAAEDLELQEYAAMKSRLRNVLWKRDAEENRRKKLEEMHAHKARFQEMLEAYEAGDTAKGDAIRTSLTSRENWDLMLS